MLSIKYHAIFDYKLVKSDFPKWLHKEDITPLRQGFEGLASIKSKTRIQREKYSQDKLKIAKKASTILSKIPTIKFVGVTGSLAMMNANQDSDIDLMIITKNGTLWLTRLCVYLSFVICHLSFRRSFDHSQKDALCLNIWLDESDLIWDKKSRNIYTAHEIAQIVPLVNKDRTYEIFLWKNKWILDYWPNSVKIENWKFNGNWKLETGKFNFLEKICYLIQYNYMKSKISREVITKTRALFHPQDWGKVVLDRLKAY